MNLKVITKLNIFFSSSPLRVKSKRKKKIRTAFRSFAYLLSPLPTPYNFTRARGNSSFAGRRVGGALDEIQVGRGTPDDASVTTQASPYDQSTPVTASSRFPRSQSTLPRSSQPRGDERSALGVGYSAEFFFPLTTGMAKGRDRVRPFSGIRVLVSRK